MPLITYLPILTNVINSSVKQNEFPNELKLADVLRIYKKDPFNEEKSRFVSLLSHMYKVFDRLLYKQIETFVSNKCLQYTILFNLHVRKMKKHTQQR